MRRGSRAFFFAVGRRVLMSVLAAMLGRGLVIDESTSDDGGRWLETSAGRSASRR